MDKDAIVRKDDKDLPFIPGRTIKGLLKDQLSLLTLAGIAIPEGFEQAVFGEAQAEEKLAEVTAEKAGPKSATCHFANATLPLAIAAAIPTAHRQHLYTRRSATKIGANGLALDKSLRIKELTIPLYLEGAIYGFPNKADYRKTLERLCHLIKRLGVNRTRGLGRCTISVL